MITGNVRYHLQHDRVRVKCEINPIWGFEVISKKVELPKLTPVHILPPKWGEKSVLTKKYFFIFINMFQDVVAQFL